MRTAPGLRLGLSAHMNAVHDAWHTVQHVEVLFVGQLANEIEITHEHFLKAARAIAQACKDYSVRRAQRLVLSSLRLPWLYTVAKSSPVQTRSLSNAQLCDEGLLI
jgi:hypothetical protein